MKQILSYSIIMAVILGFFSCKKTYEDYPGGVVNPVISIYDLKSFFKGSPYELSEESMLGSTKIAGVVTSNHSGNNLPEGLLIVQDIARFDNRRALAVNIGANAANYVPGDSVKITLTGGKMERVNGILQVTGVSDTAVHKLKSGAAIYTQVIGDVNTIVNNPDVYESALITITSAEIIPAPQPGQTFSGDRVINDGSGDFIVYTETDAAFAIKTLPFLASYIGIVFPFADQFKLVPRTEQDIIVLSDKPPVISPIIITGFLADPIGTDGNHEYIQFKATRNIDFAVTPMSVVVCNNAGATTPTGMPVNGWAMGGTLLNGTSRTYKFDLTSGTVNKGAYFYVGGNKLISGANSTDISSANWIVSKLYTSLPGDGFGNPTSNLLANSGNAAGIAVFNTTTVDASTEPIDVIMYGGGGNVFSVGPPTVGYRITNTDYYETQNTAVPTLDSQPFYSQGTNTFRFGFPLVSYPSGSGATPVATYFGQLGGTYNVRTGKWPVKRTLTNVHLDFKSQLPEIEGATTLHER